MSTGGLGRKATASHIKQPSVHAMERYVHNASYPQTVKDEAMKVKGVKRLIEVEANTISFSTSFDEKENSCAQFIYKRIVHTTNKGSLASPFTNFVGTTF
eukprot:scaffold23672_cov72-Skeletonema_dohrnii-CCMP3373.AAC.1